VLALSFELRLRQLGELAGALRIRPHCARCVSRSARSAFVSFLFAIVLF
jgi:hypothetical protein